MCRWHAPVSLPQVDIGPLSVWPPVVLAPMAGVTNWPFRAICRRFGAGLYVSEMVTARPLVEGRAKTLMLAEFGEDESPRSLQLYGVDPHYVGEAVKWLVGEGHVDHIDMNFGCPVPKVTRKGGGSAIPAKPRLLTNIVRAAVRNAEEIPVTIKFRMGIDDSLLTYEDAGRIAEGEGCAAVALHARTAAQLYDGEAQWDAIGQLEATRSNDPRARQRRHLGSSRRASDDANDGMRRRRDRSRVPRPPVAISRPGRGIRRTRATESADFRRGRRHRDRACHAPERMGG